jgi:hypothetical protein
MKYATLNLILTVITLVFATLGLFDVQWFIAAFIVAQGRILTTMRSK